MSCVPAYAIAATSLITVSSSGSAPVADHRSNSAVAKQGVAVPTACGAVHVSRYQGSKLIACTIFCLTVSNGRFSICRFRHLQANACRLNDAPGNHAGTCFTGLIFKRRLASSERPGGLTETQVIHEVRAEDSRLAEREEGLVCNRDVKISLRRDLMSIGKHHDDGCGRPKSLPSG